MLAFIYFRSALRIAVRFAALRFSIVTPLYCFLREEVVSVQILYIYIVTALCRRIHGTVSFDGTVPSYGTVP